MRTSIFAFLVLAFLIPRPAPAATVTYGLDLSVPGEFQIFASASAGDNHGLLAYGLPLTAETSAMITGFEHVSPVAAAAMDADSQLGPAGFSLLRMTYTLPGGGLTFCGSQDMISGTPHLIRGFGQTAGSFSDLGLTSLAEPEQPTWSDAVLLARGTYVGDPSNFHIDTRSVDLVANVFAGPTGGQNVQAEVRVTGANGYQYTPLPPPPPPVVPPPVAPPPVEGPIVSPQPPPGPLEPPLDPPPLAPEPPPVEPPLDEQPAPQRSEPEQPADPPVQVFPIVEPILPIDTEEWVIDPIFVLKPLRTPRFTGHACIATADGTCTINFDPWLGGAIVTGEESSFVWDPEFDVDGLAIRTFGDVHTTGLSHFSSAAALLTSAGGTGQANAPEPSAALLALFTVFLTSAATKRVRR